MKTPLHAMCINIGNDLIDRKDRSILLCISKGARYENYRFLYPMFNNQWCFFDIKRIAREKINETIIKEQTRALQNHVKKMEEKYDEIRSIRHDMNHHLEVLSALINEGKSSEVQDYLSSMKTLVNETRITANTGNPVTDIIISESGEEALRDGIDFKQEFVYPIDFGLDIFDVSGILGNALSNAFTACRRFPTGDKQAVTITSFTKGNMYVIEVTNSYGGSLVFDPVTGLPKRTVAEDGHGIGLVNMKNIAKKYNGDITMEQEGDTVILAVILQKSLQ